jgi:quercetin dioxygenase-like cupin family protein
MAMTHAVRRIVAQHDETGRARFAIDEQVDMPPIGGRGSFSSLMWVTDRTPSDNMDLRDLRGDLASLVSEGGTAVRVLDVSPTEETPMHRTVSIDYVIITKGEIDLELEGGEVLTVRAGDILIQRGTNHRWVNRSGEWMQMVAILIAAQPVLVDGRVLAEVHI